MEIINGIGMLKNRWINCIKENMDEKGVYEKIHMNDRNGSKRHTAPTLNNFWNWAGG